MKCVLYKDRNVTSLIVAFYCNLFRSYTEMTMVTFASLLADFSAQ